MDVWTEVNNMSRERIVELLESTGTACFDDEPTQLLRECLVENIDSGNLDLVDCVCTGYRVGERHPH